MTPTLLTLLATLRPLEPLGWGDVHAPSPCRSCGLPALEHEVLGERLVCPGTAGGPGETCNFGEETVR